MPSPRHANQVATMRARRTLSVTDFRKNPSRHMTDAMGDTLAVLSRNRVEFYAVPPMLFEALIDRIEALEGDGRR
ncbi:hypothetical protein [Parvibaculum sp.]|uniref:hypothetical protein n=1 Tax=Parvibaculum sp. TaxID=2024848 RepID=UPI003BA8BF49